MQSTTSQVEDNGSTSSPSSGRETESDNEEEHSPCVPGRGGAKHQKSKKLVKVQEYRVVQTLSAEPPRAELISEKYRQKPSTKVKNTNSKERSKRKEQPPLIPPSLKLDPALADRTRAVYATPGSGGENRDKEYRAPRTSEETSEEEPRRKTYKAWKKMRGEQKPA